MKKFYNGMIDRVFKNTLCSYKDHRLLIWLLETCLEIKIDKVILKDKELYKDNIFSKGKTVDLLIETDNEMINVEINNHPHKGVNERNLAYLANLYVRNVDVSNDYTEVKKCIQLNLTSGKKDIDLKSEYALLKRNSKEEEFYSENFKIYEINVDLLKESYYNNDKEVIDKYKAVIMLTLDREELEKLSMGDERVMEYRKRVEELNDNENFIQFMSEEEDKIKTENTLKNILEEQSAELKEKTIELEKQSSELEEKSSELEKKSSELEEKSLKLENMARSLKEKNVDIEIISETTGLSIEEIQSL